MTGVTDLQLQLLTLLVVAFFIDFSPVIRARQRRKHWTGTANRNDDFTIVIPIYGKVSYLTNAPHLRRYGSRVLLSTTTREKPEFYADLDRIADEYGFQILRSDIPRKRAHLCPALTKAGVDATHTAYVMRLDADTVPEGDLDELVAVFAGSELAVTSLRTLPSRAQTVVEKLQSIEYEISMDMRFDFSWLTSGAGFLGRTSVLKTVFHSHTLFDSGEDVEFGKLAKLMRFTVGHIPFVLRTDVPDTFAKWFRQRIVWEAGNFRHQIVNFYRYNWRRPTYFLYYTVILYLMTPLRWYAAVKSPEYLLVIIGAYWLFTYVMFWRQRSWALLLFPIYSLVSVMVITPLGIWKYLRIAATARMVGRISIRRRRHRQAPVHARVIAPARRIRTESAEPSDALRDAMANGANVPPVDRGRHRVRNDETVLISAVVR
ncbi:hypothetical protein Voc01_053000 [Virgisporangium ochraceum]|uniref:Glycosyltransferase n=1 Tax=Virgisporangium ochraceum TaxID=65505 RepID=A0A8J3ZWB4_9ACTN|nr:hypothetical protein Voc01_053000 [Virgisporangium ochraceum]